MRQRTSFTRQFESKLFSICNSHFNCKHSKVVTHNIDQAAIFAMDQIERKMLLKNHL